jgi:hypothetical protein
MLHDIRENSKNFFPERYKLPYFITTDQFNCILKIFEDKKIPLPTLNEELIFTKNHISNDLSVLSFDDGLKDHLEVARQLASKNIKACFFIPSGPILESKIIDSHKIQFILASTKSEKVVNFIKKSYESHFNCSANALDEFYISRWKYNIWTKEMVFVTRVLREHCEYLWRRDLIDDLFYNYVSKDSVCFASEFYLNLDEVYEIISLGHLIGGHGHYSFDLRFETYDTINSEIAKTNKFLNNLSQSQKVYAYANGGYNQNVLEVLKVYEFDYGFTTKNHSASLTDFALEMPRIDATKIFFSSR